MKMQVFSDTHMKQYPIYWTPHLLHGNILVTHSDATVFIVVYYLGAPDIILPECTTIQCGQEEARESMRIREYLTNKHGQDLKYTCALLNYKYNYNLFQIC